jgi:hypothetical protein
MGWTAYRLVYQAKSPVHIGWHTLGYIKLTRYYITGKAMWGAMTANLVRACYGYDDYADVGNLLCSEIIASYFYPALYPDIPLIPKYTNEELKYGSYTASEFEKLFIKSYGQTAVLPESNTAEDGTLHESEYIQPIVDIDGEQEQVYFIGYVFINDKAEYNGVKLEIENIKDALKDLHVGGDRKYGWGRLRLFNEPEKESEQHEMFGFTLRLNGEYPIITIPDKDKNYIPAHLTINNKLQLKGDIEPLVGREWGEVKDSKGKRIIGAGQKISEANICWVPGSVLQEEKTTLKICDFGILHPAG